MSSAVEADKPLPSFPLRYRGAGRFQNVDHFGVSLDGENLPPPAYFKLPQICKEL